MFPVPLAEEFRDTVLFEHDGPAAKEAWMGLSGDGASPGARGPVGL